MVDFKGKLEVMPVNMNIQEQDQGEKGHAVYHQLRRKNETKGD